MDIGPLARLEAVKRDAAAPGEIFRLLTERKTLKEIAVEWRVAKGRFTEWFTMEHAGLYDAALKVVAAEIALEALEIADAQREAVKESGGTYDPEVARDKLRVDTRLKLAAKFDRSRYGDAVTVQHTGETVLRLDFGRPAARVLEHDVTPSATVALPLAKGDYFDAAAGIGMSKADEGDLI